MAFVAPSWYDSDSDNPAAVPQASRAGQTERGQPGQDGPASSRWPARGAIPLILALDAAPACHRAQRCLAVDGAIDSSLATEGKACGVPWS
jgi:hypothetical protein